MSIEPRPSLRSRVLSTGVALLLAGGSLVACSADGSNSEAATTTSEAPAESNDSTPAEPDEESGSDSASSGSDGASSGSDGASSGSDGASSTLLDQETIDALLPTAEDLGPDWSSAGPIETPEASDATKAFDDAIASDCPDLAEFQAGERPLSRLATFTHSDGWDATVGVNPDPDTDFDRIDEFIAAANECTLEFTNPSNDADYEVAMTARPSDHYGEFGVMTLDEMVLTRDDGEVLSYDLYDLTFLVGDATVLIRVNSGFDDDGNRVEPDLTLVDALAEEMEMRLEEAQGLA